MNLQRWYLALQRSPDPTLLMAWGHIFIYQYSGKEFPEEAL